VAAIVDRLRHVIERLADNEEELIRRFGMHAD